MRIECYVRLQTHTQNMYYFLLLHGNNGNGNAPGCYVTRTLSVLLCCHVKDFDTKHTHTHFVTFHLIHVRYHVHFRLQKPKQGINFEFRSVIFPKSVPVPVLRSHPSSICSTDRYDHHHHHHHHHHRVCPFSHIRTGSNVFWYSASSLTLWRLTT